MRRTQLLALLAIIAFAAACATAPTSSEPTTNSTRGALQTVAFSAEEHDDNVAVRLENGSSRPLGANLCTARLEANRDGQWQPVDGEVEKQCVDEHAVINPGGNREASFSTRGLPQGEYRVAMKIEIPMGLGFEDIATPSFEIGDAPTKAPGEDEVDAVTEDAGELDEEIGEEIEEVEEIDE